MKETLLLAGFLVATCAHADPCLLGPVATAPNVVTSTFGKQRDLPQYNGVPKTHWGVDFRAKKADGTGDDLLAVTDGEVVFAGFAGGGYGNRVVIERPNGDLVTYNHLAKIDPAIKEKARAYQAAQKSQQQADNRRENLIKWSKTM